MSPKLRLILAFFIAPGLTWGLNWLGVAWVQDMIVEAPTLNDNYAMFLTLVLPAFTSGLLAGWIAGAQGMNVCAFAFALFMVCGFIHPFWRVPLVSPESVDNRLLHYFLYNPIVALTFGSLGGWLGSQFATGRFVLTDRNPVQMPGMED